MWHWTTGLPTTVTIVVAGLTLVITSRMELSQFEMAGALAVIPSLFGLLATWFLFIWGSRRESRGLSSRNQTRIAELQIATIWGPSLSKMREVIALGGERIKLAQAELEKELGDGRTSIYELIRIGYKCTQTCSSIHFLCAKGFPDQALSLCRGLMEQEANLWFIATVDDPEEVAQRYLDWQRASFYRYIRDHKDSLDKRNLGPTTEEWGALTEDYRHLEAKYAGNGNLEHREQWAIGTRADGTKRIEAFSVRQRAWQSMPWLPSDETQAYDAWSFEWQRLNEFTHTTPRSIFESASSNDQNFVAIGQSVLGIDEPMVIAGRSMLNISTILTNIASGRLPKGKSRRAEDLGGRMVKAVRHMLEGLEGIPSGAYLWHRRIQSGAEFK